MRRDSQEHTALLAQSDEAQPGQYRSAFHRRCSWLVASHWYHLTVLELILLDVVLIIGELAIALAGIDPAAELLVHDILTALSLGILSLFLVEIILHVYVFGVGYLWHWTHFLDSAVIVVAFVLEIALHGVAQELAGLLVLIRFWRIIRLMDAVALTVAMHSEEALETERKRNLLLQTQLEQWKQRALQAEAALSQIQSRSDSTPIVL